MLGRRVAVGIGAPSQWEARRRNIATLLRVQRKPLEPALLLPILKAPKSTLERHRANRGEYGQSYRSMRLSQATTSWLLGLDGLSRLMTPLEMYDLMSRLRGLHPAGMGVK